jgi:hypothetical protein
MKPQIQIAVDWWAIQLAVGTKQDNGDAMTTVLMNVLASKVPQPTPTQLDTFKAALAAEIEAGWAKPWTRNIVNDYGVDAKLAAAATKAGIQAACPPFPIKTGMDISDTELSVRLGYNGKWQVLWQSAHPGSSDAT